MNPNSANQIWSHWTFTVQPGQSLAARLARFDFVKANCAPFGRRVFGSASEMRITQTEGCWIVEVRTEGHPVHDPHYVEYIRRIWTRHFVSGFGAGTVVQLETKLEAGSRQDGTPADQLIIIPPLSLPVGEEP